MVRQRDRFSWIYLSIFSSLIGVLGGYRFAYGADADWYYQIADGKMSQVIHPFAVRQLAPLIVRLIHTMLHLSLNHSFLLLGLVSLISFAGMYFWTLQANSLTWHWMLTAASLSFWAVSFSNYMLPDLLNSVLGNLCTGG